MTCRVLVPNITCMIILIILLICIFPCFPPPPHSAAQHTTSAPCTSSIRRTCPSPDWASVSVLWWRAGTRAVHVPRTTPTADPSEHVAWPVAATATPPRPHAVRLTPVAHGGACCLACPRSIGLDQLAPWAVVGAVTYVPSKANLAVPSARRPKRPLLLPPRHVDIIAGRNPRPPRMLSLPCILLATMQAINGPPWRQDRSGSI